jgi:hypothetical protein
MSRDSVGVTRGRFFSKYPIEWFIISNTIYDSKEGEHTQRGSFSLEFECIGYDAT